MSGESPNSINLPDSSRVRVERGGLSSIIPSAMREAKSKSLQVSLFLLLVIIAGAYWAGRDSARGVTEAEVKVIVAAQDNRLAEVAKALSAMAEIQKVSHGEASRERAQIREMVHANVLETQLVKSHVSQR